MVSACKFKRFIHCSLPLFKHLFCKEGGIFRNFLAQNQICGRVGKHTMQKTAKLLTTLPDK